MDSEKINKLWKTSRNNAIVLLILQIIVIIYGYNQNGLAYFSVVNIILSILMFVLYICTIIGCQKHTKLGSIGGIILSIIYLISALLTYNILDGIVGVFLIIDFVKLNKSLKA